MIPFHPRATVVIYDLEVFKQEDFACVYRAPALAALKRLADEEGVPLGPVQEHWEGAVWIAEVPPNLQPQAQRGAAVFTEQQEPEAADAQ